MIIPPYATWYSRLEKWIVTITPCLRLVNFDYTNKMPYNLSTTVSHAVHYQVVDAPRLRFVEFFLKCFGHGGNGGFFPSETCFGEMVLGNHLERLLLRLTAAHHDLLKIQPGLVSDQNRRRILGL